MAQTAGGNAPLNGGASIAVINDANLSVM